MATVTITPGEPVSVRPAVFRPVTGVVTDPTEFTLSGRADAVPPKPEVPAIQSEFTAPYRAKTLRFVCPWYGDIPEKNETVMRLSRARVEEVGHIWELHHMPAVGDAKDSAIAKDLYVLDLARKMPDAVFLDGDIEVRYMWAMQPGRPYFIHEGQDQDNPIGTPRIGMFAVNGCCTWFDNLQIEKDKRKIQNVYGFPNKLFRDKITGIIPAECYFHYRFTSGKS